jgi:outer membrane protein OmpA-like peptidoglycan-associated protein
MSLNTWFIAAFLTVAVPAAAQTPQNTSPQPSQAQSDDERGRVAITPNGDAGLWWVPVGDTNGKGMWRGGAARNSRNTPQGHMNVATFTAAVSYGFTDRFDAFASFDAIQRVDRDLRSLFVATDPERGGVDTRLPYAREPWTGNKMGDLRVGGKVGLLSEAGGHPVSASAIVAFNIPTADADNGAGQGSVAADISGVMSRWISSKAVLSGTVGYNFRKNPSDPVVVHVPNNFHWGLGLGITPTTSWLIHAELLGDQPVRDNAALDDLLIAEDGSVSPRVSFVDRQTSVTSGITWFAGNGFFVGAELRWDFPMLDRVNAPDDSRSDYLDYHVRIGWSPIKRQPAPPAITPPPPTPPPPPANRPPTVKASCDPCTVEVGTRSQLAADASDPDGDPLTYRWTAPAGTVEQPTIVKPMWLAPMVVGPVPVTVSVADGKGGTASDTVTIQVVRKEQKVYTFEDVHFDFDRYSLRPEAMRVLEQALAAMKENPTLRLTLEGHTCSIGTAEYNLALGERRSNAVRDYLTANGVAANRVTSVSFGEERPKHDNSREETRRLNRRAALVVRLDQ